MIIKPAVMKLLHEYHANLTPDDIAEVLDLIRAHEKIYAIKLIRQETSLGLKEAKDIADALEHLIQNE
jgi:ribosomal protein L7/L12